MSSHLDLQGTQRRPYKMYELLIPAAACIPYLESEVHAVENRIPMIRKV